MEASPKYLKAIFAVGSEIYAYLHQLPKASEQLVLCSAMGRHQE